MQTRPTLTRSDELPFIDWMKAIGIFVIVYGHIAGSTINHLTAPIEAKQIGVACFLFVVGFALVRERRPAIEVVVRRLFVLYVVGIALAVIISIISYVATGRAQLGNFLPFVFGANVLILENAFPANPTTWYIATYVHIVLLWAMFGRGARITVWMLVAAALAEVGVRIVLVDAVGSFFAYMALTNWMVALLWGAWQGQRAYRPERSSTRDVAVGATVLAALVIVWPMIGAPALAGDGFPYKSLVPGTPLGFAIVVSIAVSVLYVAYADALFRLTRRLPAPAPVRLLARNTVVIFIVHMPLFYILDVQLAALGFWSQKVIELLVCLILPAIASECMMRVVPFDRLLARTIVESRRLVGVAPILGRGG